MYVIDIYSEATHLPFVSERRFALNGGVGYLSGDAPDYITRIEGVPTSCTIRVFVRGDNGSPGDMYFVKQIESNVDGSWRIDNLDPNLSYDVVCRYTGYKDEIISNIKPVIG